MPARIAGICGLLAFVTVNIGWIAGGLAQPSAYSVANDDISDLGAVTASSSWIYNRIGANLTGLLVMALALGLWRALSPDVLGRLGAAVLLVAGRAPCSTASSTSIAAGSTPAAATTRGIRTRTRSSRASPAPRRSLRR
jgi:hypothetical protein